MDVQQEKEWSEPAANSLESLGSLEERVLFFYNAEEKKKKKRKRKKRAGVGWAGLE